MEILIEKEIEYETDLDVEELFNLIDKQIQKSLPLPKEILDYEVNVVLTDNAAIKELNNEFRNIDSPTDVLSFPMLEFTKPLFPVLENDMVGENLLGDIVISLEKCREQALDYGHSFKRELAFLFTHGMLHILGFDHINDDERIEMEDTQRLILDDLGIKR